METKQDNRKVKFEIDNGQAFLADEIGIIHNPLRIILDFRSVTPRIDVRNNEFQPLVLKHNVILMDPYMAKSFSDMLKQNLANYEKQFGKITKPDALKRLEKKAKKEVKGQKEEKAPNYLG
jgi:hypothetical protein